MSLSITNLKQVLAPLDECIHMRENAAERKVPSLAIEIWPSTRMSKKDSHDKNVTGRQS
jgi:hypothetical protein